MCYNTVSVLYYVHFRASETAITFDDMYPWFKLPYTHKIHIAVVNTMQGIKCISIGDIAGLKRHIIISILLWPNQPQRGLNWKRYTRWMRSGDETNINCYTIIASHSLHHLTTYWTCNTISGKQHSNIIPKFYHTGLLCLTISYYLFLL